MCVSVRFSQSQSLLPLIQHIIYVYYTLFRLDVLTTFNTSESTPSSTAFYTSNDIGYVPSGSTSSRLNSWLAINIVRAICYNISWMLSVWLNSYNRLEGQSQMLKV